jgi:C4-type Zn-finger protein
LAKLNLLKTPEGLPFTIYIEDPSGLSFIKNPQAPKLDTQIHIELYNRSIE